MRPRKKNNAVQGQLELLGDVVGYKMRHVPRKVVTRTGEAVIVLRLPPDVDDMDRAASMQAMRELARKTKVVPNKFYYMKKPRSSPR